MFRHCTSVCFRFNFYFFFGFFSSFSIIFSPLWLLSNVLHHTHTPTRYTSTHTHCVCTQYALKLQLVLPWAFFLLLFRIDDGTIHNVIKCYIQKTVQAVYSNKHRKHFEFKDLGHLSITFNFDCCFNSFFFVSVFNGFVLHFEVFFLFTKNPSINMKSKVNVRFSNMILSLYLLEIIISSWLEQTLFSRVKKMGMTFRHHILHKSLVFFWLICDHHFERNEVHYIHDHICSLFFFPSLLLRIVYRFFCFDSCFVYICVVSFFTRARLFCSFYSLRS